PASSARRFISRQRERERPDRRGGQQDDRQHHDPRNEPGHEPVTEEIAGPQERKTRDSRSDQRSQSGLDDPKTKWLWRRGIPSMGRPLGAIEANAMPDPFQVRNVSLSGPIPARARARCGDKRNAGHFSTNLIPLPTASAPSARAG